MEDKEGDKKPTPSNRRNDRYARKRCSRRKHMATHSITNGGHRQYPPRWNQQKRRNISSVLRASSEGSKDELTFGAINIDGTNEVVGWAVQELLAKRNFDVSIDVSGSTLHVTGH